MAEARIEQEKILEKGVEEHLWDFLSRSSYAARGGIITDLDGTVVHEEAGRVYIPPAVEVALKKLYDLGRPLVINTMRFPLSVMRTFGESWYALSNAPIPTITLNGSQLGFVTKTASNELTFEELTAFPLAEREVENVSDKVQGLLGQNLNDLLVFYYPRDWRKGEIIWTPVPENVEHVKKKYLSASLVTGSAFASLREAMLSEDICMIFLLIEAPEDKRMAYQHTKPRNFFTHTGVDKLFGAKMMAEKLELDLTHSIGAGDTLMDIFLSGVGLSVIVGGQELPFQGSFGTLRLKNAFELGDLLFRLAELQCEAGPLDPEPLEAKVEEVRGETQ